jgi:hypothetical protein
MKLKRESKPESGALYQKLDKKNAAVADEIKNPTDRTTPQHASLTSDYRNNGRNAIKVPVTFENIQKIPALKTAQVTFLAV